MQKKRFQIEHGHEHRAPAVEQPDGRWVSIAMLGAGLIAGLVFGLAWSGPARSADLRPRAESAPAWPNVPEAPREWRWARTDVRFDHMYMDRRVR